MLLLLHEKWFKTGLVVPGEPNFSLALFVRFLSNTCFDHCSLF